MKGKVSMMKRYFVKTEDYSFVAFVDSESRAYVIDESAFDERLTIEVAKAADYSNLDGCETAEECAYCIGIAEPFDNIIDFNADEYENVTEF